MIIHSQVREARPVHFLLRTSTGIEAALEVSSSLLTTLADARRHFGAQEELTGSIKLLHPYNPHINPAPLPKTWDRPY